MNKTDCVATFIWLQTRRAHSFQTCHVYILFCIVPDRKNDPQVWSKNFKTMSWLMFPANEIILLGFVTDRLSRSASLYRIASCLRFQLVKSCSGPTTTGLQQKVYTCSIHGSVHVLYKVYTWSTAKGLYMFPIPGTAEHIFLIEGANKNLDLIRAP